MKDHTENTVDDVLKDPLPDHCAPHQVTGLIVIAEYLDEEGILHLGWQRTVPQWRATGMLESVNVLCRDSMLHSTNDEDNE